MLDNGERRAIDLDGSNVSQRQACRLAPENRRGIGEDGGAREMMNANSRKCGVAANVLRGRKLPWTEGDYLWLASWRGEQTATRRSRYQMLRPTHSDHYLYVNIYRQVQPHLFCFAQIEASWPAQDRSTAAVCSVPIFAHHPLSTHQPLFESLILKRPSPIA